MNRLTFLVNFKGKALPDDSWAALSDLSGDIITQGKMTLQ